MGNIFDLQHHLFRIEFDELCMIINIEKQVGVMVRQVCILSCRAVITGANLDGGCWNSFFYSLLFSYVSDGTLYRTSSHLKTRTFTIVKITTDLK